MSKKLLLLAAIALALGAFFALGLHRYLSLDFFKAQRGTLDAYVGASPVRAAALFFIAYVALTGISVPGAAITMTLAAGALFGLVWGTIIVSFASSIGATLAFLASRFLLRDWVQDKFGDKLKAINAGVAREGALYLFALRLVPLFPFFVVNLVMGVTPIRTRTFYWVSQVGMLAGTAVYVYAGTQLGEFRVSWQLGFAFALLGIFPLAAKKILDAVKARKVYARWTKPRRFDRNLVVIGAGSAGLVSAYIAAAVKAKVTLVEQHRMGGDCLNTGCVPSKALIRSAKLLSHIRRSSEFGVRSASADFDFSDVMERVQRVIKTVEPHDSVERYRSLGVECLLGSARITDPWTVEIALAEGGARKLTTRGIVIAAGARPFIPPIPGLRESEPYTSDTIWNLRALPRRLVVLGGGPIGSELAQCFARFGSSVTQVEMLPRLLMREDPEVSEMVARRFRSEGIDVLVNHKAKQVLVENGENVLLAEHDGEAKHIPFDALLCAVGRAANTAGYGLEELGIPLTQTKTVQTNEYLQTIYPNIYACGDVAGPYQFTHTASHQAWYASVNALFGRVRRFSADYSVIPWATFTEPEVARVGLNETEAKEKNIAYEVTAYGLDDLDRAITDEEAHGFVKVLTVPGKDKVLGATIVGEHAGDLIVEFILAMRHGDGAITPAISVLSAIEGLKVDAPQLAHLVVPLTIVILIGLFLVQRRGTGFIGGIFGPIMLLWFVVIGILGVRGIAMKPEILAAFNPFHAIGFLVHAPPLIGFAVLGAAFLGGDRRRGDVCRHGAFRPGADPARMVRCRAAGAVSQLFRAGCAAPVRSDGAGQSVLSARARLVALSAGRVRDRRDRDRVAGDHLRRVFADAAVDPARLPAAREHLPHRQPRARADLRADRELDAGGRDAGRRGRVRDVGQSGGRLRHRRVAPHGDHDLPRRHGGDPVGLHADPGHRRQRLLPDHRPHLLRREFGQAVRGRLVSAAPCRLHCVPDADVAARPAPGREGAIRHARKREGIRRPRLRNPPVRLPGTAAFLTSGTVGIPLPLTHHLKHIYALHERVLLVTVLTSEEPRVAEEARVELHDLPRA